MAGSLDRQVVLVVGGSSGIGLQVARLAAAEGASLIVTGRHRERLEQAARALAEGGATVTPHLLDAADSAGVQAFFAELAPFDHLVSMAGGFMGGGFLDAPLELIRKAVEEKLFANLQIARCAAPKLREGGSMVFTAGSGGKPQNASGAIVGNDAIRTLVKGLAVELAPKARANAVSPTWMRTPLWRHLSESELAATEAHFAQLIPLGRTAQVAEVAEAYLFLLKNCFVTGQTLAVDGGIELVG